MLFTTLQPFWSTSDSWWPPRSWSDPSQCPLYGRSVDDVRIDASEWHICQDAESNSPHNCPCLHHSLSKVWKVSLSLRWPFRPSKLSPNIPPTSPFQAFRSPFQAFRSYISTLGYDRLLEHSPISTTQWDFLLHWSTMDAVLSAVYEWHQMLEKVCTVFFDLQKAFDSVSLCFLIEKLRQLDINVYVLRWITNCLMNRSHSVGTCWRCCFPVLSGVPQGQCSGTYCS